MADDPAPGLAGILETVLYVDDLARAASFYEAVLGLTPAYEDHRMRAYDVAGHGMLLLFRRGASLQTVTLPGGTIPSHDGGGPAHVAFSVGADKLSAWQAHLSKHGIAIEGGTEWPRGGRSVYFRDPDSHLLELATPGLWPGY